ncbi:hypothetical protein [Thermococcus sp. JCM 11816]|uniref:hypothetical protein n=1 Tax=Thermococcus sp. (strain JCM 11816 / KS-1) TaxID=1295125 RepID=UPI0006D24E2C
MPFKIDFERNLLYIEDSIPYKFIKGVSILKNTLSLKSILKEGMSEEDINMRFKKFLDDIRAILIIKQAISAQRENTKKIRRRTPPQDSENQVINVDEFVRKSFLQRLQKISESEREFYLSLIELKYRKESQQEPISYLLNLPLPAVVKVKDVFSIKDVDIDVSDIEIDDIEDEKLKEKLSGIDDLVRIELKGDRDIFENETVKAYITAGGGRIVGISGLLHYGIGVYEFSLKHGVNFNIQEVPGYIKVKRKGKEIIESDEEREELENVFNLLLALYVHTFIS